MIIKKINQLDEKDYTNLMNRYGDDFTSIMVNTVVPIVNDVRARGDVAVSEYMKKFDGAELDYLMATAEEIENGFSRVNKGAIDAFMEAKKNIEEYHTRQKRTGFQYERGTDGTFGMIYQPIERAAIYVPGGKASYPSSVLMGLIPAILAGVEQITLITPVKADGKLHDVICAICKILGITRILKAGGAHGIAAAAFGTASIPKSDIIVGPGNVYVTAAKSYLFSQGIIQIDSLAGPSETLVITDDNTDPKWVAWDLLSQAEHEENAKAVLIDLSEDHAKKVVQEIEKDLENGKGRIEIKRASVLKNMTILTADSIDEAISFSNKYAPEHMQVMVKDPLSHLNKIKNVGSLFLGKYSPVAIGDYFSGTNHVLPTGGAARFSSGLSVETFYRRTTYQMISEEGLRRAVGPVNIMSEIEGFSDKHGGSVRIRFGGE
jgi:histidinol dehydrogenase